MRDLAPKLGLAILLLLGSILAVIAYRFSLPDAVSKPVQLTLFPPETVPAIHFTDQDGKGLTLADFRGKLVVLNVWATWCAPCRAEFPRLDHLQAEMGGADLAVLALSVDLGGRKQVDRFYDEIKVKNLAEYLDPSGESAKTLGLRGLPTTLILDRQGREVARIEGEVAWDGPEVKALLQKLIGSG